MFKVINKALLGLVMAASASLPGNKQDQSTYANID